MTDPATSEVTQLVTLADLGGIQGVVARMIGRGECPTFYISKGIYVRLVGAKRAARRVPVVHIYAADDGRVWGDGHLHTYTDTPLSRLDEVLTTIVASVAMRSKLPTTDEVFAHS